MRLFSFFISFLLCLGLVSCSHTERSASDILSSLTEAHEDLPAGVIYTPRADEGESGYLSFTLAEALWGEDAKEGFSMLSDFAIYMSSFATPYEIGVFCCYSSTDAKRIEELCYARADIISVALRQTEFYSLCRNIRVVREGRVVVFLLTSDPARSVKMAKRLI